MENKTVSQSKRLQMAKVGEVGNDSGKRSNPGWCYYNVVSDQGQVKDVSIKFFVKTS